MDYRADTAITEEKLGELTARIEQERAVAEGEWRASPAAVAPPPGPRRYLLASVAVSCSSLAPFAVSLVVSHGVHAASIGATIWALVGAIAAGTLGFRYRNVVLPLCLLALVPLLGARPFLDLTRTAWDGGLVEYWCGAAVLGVASLTASAALAFKALAPRISRLKGLPAPPRRLVRHNDPSLVGTRLDPFSAELADLAANVAPRAPESLREALRRAQEALAALRALVLRPAPPAPSRWPAIAFIVALPLLALIHVGAVVADPTPTRALTFASSVVVFAVGLATCFVARHASFTDLARRVPSRLARVALLAVASAVFYVPAIWIVYNDMERRGDRAFALTDWDGALTCKSPLVDYCGVSLRNGSLSLKYTGFPYGAEFELAGARLVREGFGYPPTVTCLADLDLASVPIDHRDEADTLRLPLRMIRRWRYPEQAYLELVRFDAAVALVESARLGPVSFSREDDERADTIVVFAAPARQRDVYARRSARWPTEMTLLGDGTRMGDIDLVAYREEGQWSGPCTVRDASFVVHARRTGAKVAERTFRLHGVGCAEPRSDVASEGDVTAWLESLLR